MSNFKSAPGQSPQEDDAKFLSAIAAHHEAGVAPASRAALEASLQSLGWSDHDLRSAEGQALLSDPSFARNYMEGYEAAFAGKPGGLEVAQIPRLLLDDPATHPNVSKNLFDQVACGAYLTPAKVPEFNSASSSARSSDGSSPAVTHHVPSDFDILSSSMVAPGSRSAKYKACYLGYIIGQKQFQNAILAGISQTTQPNKTTTICLTDNQEGLKFGKIACKTIASNKCEMRFRPNICDAGCFSAGYATGFRECVDDEKKRNSIRARQENVLLGRAGSAVRRFFIAPLGPEVNDSRMVNPATVDLSEPVSGDRGSVKPIGSETK